MKSIWILTLMTLAFSSLAAAAGAPALLSYQGQLTNAAGLPITVPTPVRFTLLWGGTASENPSTGKPVYQEDVTVTPDTNGVLHHLIGSGSPTSGCDENRDGTAAEPCVLAPDDFPDAATPVFLELRIDPSGANNPLLPRQRIASVGYALNADTVDGVEAAALTAPPKSMVIDSGVITVPASTTGTFGPINLDGFDTVSIQVLTSGSFSSYPSWRNSSSIGFDGASDCAAGSRGTNANCLSVSSYFTSVQHYNVVAKEMQISYNSGTLGGTIRFVLYLRRQG